MIRCHLFHHQLTDQHGHFETFEKVHKAVLDNNVAEVERLMEVESHHQCHIHNHKHM